jgi:4-amino-4-deoxy-L-arabinose transferase-like glycosyltransferase
LIVRYGAAALCALLLILNVAAMRHLSITYDEPRHLRYGQNVLAGNSDRFDDSKMPLSALNALPGALARRLAAGPLATALAAPEAGRYVTVLFSLLLAICVFAWARELYGPAAGLLALSLYTFDPNVLAHSELITTDLYAAGTVTMACYAFWRFLTRGGFARAATAAVMLGLALLAKYTALALIPIFVAIAVGFHWRELRARAARFAAWTALFVAIGLSIVNAGFLFNRTLTRFDAYAFRSDLFRGAQRNAGAAGALRVPVPYPYLEGLDWVIQRERTGEGYGPIYLLGELRHARAFPGYYFYATLFKTPLPTLLIIAAAIGGYVGRRRRFEFWRNEWVLACPVLFFTIYFNFFYRAQIGIRYFLVVFPLLYVYAGSLLAGWTSVARRTTIAVTAAVTLTAASVVSYFPHFIPYFNELVPDRRLAYRILADSNLDWRQHRWYLNRYLAQHPEAIVEPERPRTGTILVGVNTLTGVGADVARYAWLRDNFTPVDHIAYSVLIYRITPADLQRVEISNR